MSGGAAGVSQALSAAERRELRRKRILEGSESRIQQILSGPDGTEKRSAPAVEGGDFFSVAEPPAMSSSKGSETDLRGEECSRTVPSIRRDRPDEFSDWKYCNLYMQQHSFEISLLAGIILRVMVAISLLKNVVLLWMVCALLVECVTFSSSRRTVPQNFYISLLSQFGFSQTFVNSTGYLYRIISNVMSHSVLAAFGFLSTHLLFTVINYSLGLIGL